MAERDYPVGHPAASDYAGERYTPPRAPFAEDFDPGHPARGGKNIKPIDTPDGMRAAQLKADKANAERTAAMESQQPQPQADGDSTPLTAGVTTITIDGTVQTTAPER